MNTRGPDHHYGQILARQIEQTNAQRTKVEAAEWGAIVMHIRLFSTPLACVGLRYAVPVLVPPSDLLEGWISISQATSTLSYCRCGRHSFCNHHNRHKHFGKLRKDGSWRT